MEIRSDGLESFDLKVSSRVSESISTCCKSEKFDEVACISIPPPSLLAELDWLAKFLISYEVKVVPGSVRFMTRTSSEVNVAEIATDVK